MFNTTDFATKTEDRARGIWATYQIDVAKLGGVFTHIAELVAAGTRPANDQALAQLFDAAAQIAPAEFVAANPAALEIAKRWAIEFTQRLHFAQTGLMAIHAHIIDSAA